MIEKILRAGRKIIPSDLFRGAQPLYHFLLALIGACAYRFPSRHIKVVGVTGTKGKSTVTEFVNSKHHSF